MTMLMEMHESRQARLVRLGFVPLAKVTPRRAPVALSEPARAPAPAIPWGAPFDFLSPPSWRTIAHLVALKHGITFADILGPQRTRPFTVPRHEAIGLVTTHTDLSEAEIGRRFGRDRSTVRNSVRRYLKRPRPAWLPPSVDQVPELPSVDIATRAEEGAEAVAKCPCCGAAVLQPLSLAGVVLALPGSKRSILSLFVSAYPHALSYAEISASTWTGRRAAPEDPRRSIATQCCMINKIIRPFGWVIRADCGKNSTGLRRLYRIKNWKALKGKTTVSVERPVDFQKSPPPAALAA